MDFSAETLQVRRNLVPIFSILKEKEVQPGILCPPKLSFINKEEIKYFPGKQLLRDFIFYHWTSIMRYPKRVLNMEMKE